MVYCNTCDTLVDGDVSASKNIFFGGSGIRTKLGAYEVMVKEPFDKAVQLVNVCLMKKDVCLRIRSNSHTHMSPQLANWNNPIDLEDSSTVIKTMMN